MIPRTTPRPATRSASAEAVRTTSPRCGEPEQQRRKSLPFHLAGSTAELDFVRNILAYQTGVKPGQVSDLAASTMAPLLRGTQVNLR